MVFDLDGTLADTSEGIFGGIKFVQEQMNLPSVSLDIMKTHIGPPPRESFVRNFNLKGKKLENALSLYRQYAEGYAYRQATLYPHIKEVLNSMQEMNVKCAVATLKLQGTATKMIEHLGIADNFSLIRGSLAQVHLSKCEILTGCLRTMKISAEETLLIGDSEFDAIGANQAGVDFMGVTYGFGFKTKHDLNKHRNIGCVNDIRAILSYF